MTRAIYAARKAAGKCLRNAVCDAPLSRGSSLCETHRAEAREYKRRNNAAAYDLKKRRGQCTQTGCLEKAASGGLRCQGCIDKKKATKAARTAAGKCNYSTGCNLRAVKNGCCVVHAPTKRRLMAELYHRRQDDCICTRCGAFELMTAHLCRACYLQRREGKPSARFAAMTDGERLFYATSRHGE